jgi:phage tail-like protein
MDALKNIIGFLNDPVPNFFFGVLVVDNPMASAKAAVGMISQLDPIASAFTEVSGLEVGMDLESNISEGGNQIPIRLPGRIKADTLKLKRYLRPRHIAVGGFSLDPLTGWSQDVFTSAKTWADPIEVKDLIIVIYHPQIKNPLPIGPSAFPIAGYLVLRAYPVRWATGDLNSTSDSEPVTEEFEFSYEEIQRLAIPPV